MIKVLHILESAKSGGISNLVLDLLDQQRRNADLESELFINQQVGTLLGRIEALGVSKHVPPGEGDYHIRIKKFTKILTHFRNFHIIHFHSYNHFLFICAILSRRKIVYTMHSLHLAPGRIRKMSDPLKHFIFKLFFQHFVHYITFNSYFTQEYSLDLYKLKKKNYSIIYNGINFNRILGLSIPTRKKTFTIGTVCSLVKLKRVDIIVNAFAKANIPDSNLIIVGDGPEKPELEKLVCSLGMDRRISFTGYQENTVDFYHQFDIFISASISETFGLVAIEAMYHGIPVIAMIDGGGIVEIIKVIEPDNIVQDMPQLVARMRYFFENPKAVEENIQKRKHYAESFSMIKMETSLFSVYNSIILQ